MEDIFELKAENSELKRKVDALQKEKQDTWTALTVAVWFLNSILVVFPCSHELTKYDGFRGFGWIVLLLCILCGIFTFSLIEHYYKVNGKKFELDLWIVPALIYLLGIGINTAHLMRLI